MAYRKIDTRVWNDAKFMALSDDAKLIFFFCLTHPHLTMIGAMRCSLIGLADELGWEGLPKRFPEGFRQLLGLGLLNYDDSGRLLWIPNFLKYNSLDNPNQFTAAVNCLDLLPECILKIHIINALAPYSERFNKPLPEGLFEGLPEPLLQPEAGTGTEKKKLASPKSKLPPSGDHQLFVRWWCMAFEKVFEQKATIDGKNAKLIQKMLKDVDGVKRLVAFASVVLTSDDPFYSDAGRTIGVLSSQLEAFKSRKNNYDLARWREYGIAPPDGTAFEDWKFWEVTDES